VCSRETLFFSDFVSRVFNKKTRETRGGWDNPAGLILIWPCMYTTIQWESWKHIWIDGESKDRPGKLLESIKSKLPLLKGYEVKQTGHIRWEKVVHIGTLGENEHRSHLEDQIPLYLNGTSCVTFHTVNTNWYFGLSNTFHTTTIESLKSQLSLPKTIATHCLFYKVDWDGNIVSHTLTASVPLHTALLPFQMACEIFPTPVVKRFSSIICILNGLQTNLLHFLITPLKV